MSVKPKKPAESVPSPVPTLSYAEFTTFGRDNIEAAVKANSAFSAGFEALSQEAMGYARSTFESAGETARAMLAARTFEDFVRLQTEFAKRHFDELVAGSTKFSEIGMALSREAFAPFMTTQGAKPAA